PGVLADHARHERARPGRPRPEEGREGHHLMSAADGRTEILISGFGGQGVIRMGQILGLCAIKQGHRVTMLKSHGTETRGGYVRAQLVISPRYVDSPVVENADVFVAFSAPAYRKFFDFCRGKILYDPEMVEEVRSEAPERHVAVAAGRSLTYEELWRAVRGVASGLTAAGVERGTRVGLCLPNSAALVIGYYATWVAGGTVVPVNPGAREGEIEQHVTDAGVAVVVGPSAQAAETVASRLKLPFIDARELQAMESRPPAVPVAGDSGRDVAVLLYTGGTTGAPKGAMLSHRNIVVNTTQFAEWYAFAPGDEVSV